MVCVPISQVREGALTGSAGVGAGEGALGAVGALHCAAMARKAVAC